LERPPERSSSEDSILSEVSYAPNLPSWLPVSKGDFRAFIANGWRYIKNRDGSEELYRFKNDPLEEHNLIESGRGHPELMRFRNYLDLHKKVGSSKTVQ